MKKALKLFVLSVLIMALTASYLPSDANSLDYPKYNELIRISNEDLNEVVPLGSPLFEGAKKKEFLTVLSYTDRGMKVRRIDQKYVDLFEKDFLSKEGYLSWDENLNILSLFIAKEGTDKEKAFRIYEYVSKMKYDYEKAEKIESREIRVYLPDNKRTLETQKGICFDLASLYVSMLRSIGIKSKMVKGEANGVYHAWSEVFIDEEWVMVDPTASLFISEMQDYIPKFKY